MLYPVEHKQGNKWFQPAYWNRLARGLRAGGWKIVMVANLESDDPFEGEEPRRRACRFRDAIAPDKVFAATSEGLRDAVTEATLAIGTSTGPTWALLLSDIPQLCLDWNVVDQRWSLARNMSMVHANKAIEVVSHRQYPLDASLAKRVSIAFHHGLGDCANVARVIPSYVRRGWSVDVECAADKRFVFL